MSKHHHYKTTIQWTGNKGTGTSGYRDYERSHTISVENKPIIEGSSDPAFRGDKTKYNPEEMFLSSLSSCHMLWYLHFCSEAGIIVTNYVDHATGIMEETNTGSGRFTEVTLHPTVSVKEESMVEKAIKLHHKANEFCFIANSVNFSVKHIPNVLVN
ncbi:MULTISPECIES: OsmC family protein [Chryseobacterium]|uniref:Organic hydroperoxide reductase OsmC/OhrA n=1 Tax=Chryseobacterium geocarposphaerae TaxID=1416776 RepID=A0ABU1LGU7_9FLAO|nr:MULTISPECIES: OsmC family protein [Chryseobacterium]MDR6405941.1 organic hydroperoxide reductase OsmC/OhrA [Chryseobacterium geocarposphaerae]MDR6699614.1 organic hydroperoxide reductase OsmC/OhrA [Chryseobacterium ginsenosidimutans]